MLQDYGCDDIEYLLANAEIPGTVTVKSHGEVFHLPVARFDNRQDLTTFLRKPAEEWLAEEVEPLEKALKSATDELWTKYQELANG